MVDDILYLENISVEFSGFKALNRVNFFMNKGELHFLIGPNGAGKTTLLDVICGKTKSTGGRMFFQGKKDLMSLRPQHIARLGISRKFQAPSIFSELTVFENLELSVNENKSFFRSLVKEADSEEKNKIEEIMEKVNLKDESNTRGGDLSHGKKQWLELGMTIIRDPKLLLVDEPVAGMTGKERDLTGQLLQDIAQNSSVLVVEHDMQFVEQFAHSVTILHEGAILCQGDFNTVSKDPTVIDVYLGRGGGDLHA
ncbi:urea ABC transporter ATP-binding protein UrtD [Candidatus Haliotispira prima]|uniref:Urea ABC transporter ATP-binding protein UrtD n=1 Tax=Candidatus Haliotispira prima TaxID=3034016 RepID=A0ABY8MJA7_9SPIO|nr:urea ABC transporter ATP-binding protein UrtD [Candidatus Haliotispira prima]